jgi:bidirectional [NiFe] hydrogenase diaphorase subunit
MADIRVDQTDLTAEDGGNLLRFLRDRGYRIPAVCYHPALKQPIGACRLCAVEIASPGKPAKIRLACTVKIQSGLAVRTDGDAVQEARGKAMRRLLAQAPQAQRLLQMAREHGLQTDPPPDGCIRCQLCERVCKEIVGANALQMIKRDNRLFIVAVEERCIGCGTCANMCPTQAIRVVDEENVRTILIRDEVIGKHPLETCEGCGKRFATPKFLEYIHRRTIPHPDLKEHHRLCPTCAKLFSTRRYRV